MTKDSRTNPCNIKYASEAVFGTDGQISNRDMMFQYFAFAISTFEELKSKSSALSTALRIEGATSAYKRLLDEVPQSGDQKAIDALARFDAYYKAEITALSLTLDTDHHSPRTVRTDELVAAHS